jgi:hypothetical protein
MVRINVFVYEYQALKYALKISYEPFNLHKIRKTCKIRKEYTHFILYLDLENFDVTYSAITIHVTFITSYK